MRKKFVSFLTAFAIAVNLMPCATFTTFAVSDHDGKVHVVVENTTFTSESEYWSDSFWYGTLVDTWVTLDDDSTMMTCIVEALENDGHTVEGAASNYITAIDGMGEFDGGFMSGWMGTLNDWFTNEGFNNWTVAEGELEAGDEICVMYTCSYGDDLGGSWGNDDSTVKDIAFSAGTLSTDFDKNTHKYTLNVPSDVDRLTVTPTASNKNFQVRTRIGNSVYKRTDEIPVADGTEIVVECNYEGALSMNENADSNTYTITVKKVTSLPAGSQDVSEVLNEAMAQLSKTVNAPVFGTTAGEWSVLCLARGGYFDKNSTYFSDYYDRIVETVNSTASSVNMNGALHKVKSTENSRLIVALSSIGKSAEKVGDWNLITPYNDFNWITKQGINGPVWALIALDSNHYQTTDATIRKQCIDYILSKQTADGGWAMSGNTADPDMTGMALQALAPYISDSKVKSAIDKGINALSSLQDDTGGYSSWGTINSESIAQVIVACTTLGINPDTDKRFVKNSKSAIDALLAFYDANSRMFKHTADTSGNAMATDQAIYALAAYNRFLNGQTSLYDMSDVSFESENADDLTATLGLPQEISNQKGTTFNAVVNIAGWDNEANYKLMDCIVDVPDSLTVTNVKMSKRVSGGQISWNLEESTGKLRVVYFDPEKNNNISISGKDFPAEFFDISFETKDKLTTDKLNISVSGMSLKFNSDSENEASIDIVDTSKASGTVNVVKSVSFSARILYQGDGIDLIPESKMAVCVSIANLDKRSKLTYNDGKNSYDFLYSDEITQKTGVMSYVALVDSAIAVTEFVDTENFTIGTKSGDSLSFGDVNGDGVINAQDALNSVNTWLRKNDAPTDIEILRLNVNSDSRINTFDALGIVEQFVHGSEYIIVNKAAMAYTPAE